MMEANAKDRWGMRGKVGGKQTTQANQRPMKFNKYCYRGRSDVYRGRRILRVRKKSR